VASRALAQTEATRFQGGLRRRLSSWFPLRWTGNIQILATHADAFSTCASYHKNWGQAVEPIGLADEPLFSQVLTEIERK
jgi:hypothetical protein